MRKYGGVIVIAPGKDRDNYLTLKKKKKATLVELHGFKRPGSGVVPWAQSCIVV